MSDFAAYVLSLALSTFPPGGKVHSLQPMPECGSERTAPACEIKPLCPEERVTCNAPQWVDGLGWARVETRETGAGRLEIVAEALADSAQFHGAAWPEGPVDLARAMLSAFGWSTGLREDIQTGRKRGPAGEVCLADMKVATLRTAVPWDLAKLPEPELVARVVGLEYGQLRTCFDAGAVMLTRARRWADRKCAGYAKTYAVFAAYGTGSSCNTYNLFGDYARLRQSTFERFRRTKVTAFPDWYAEMRKERKTQRP